jgi:hypothetical protein
MPITTAAYRHHSPFPASAQLSKTKQAVIVRVHCFKRRGMAQACLVAQDTLTIASKLRGLPSPVIIHVLIDEKPPNSSPSPVIIHLFIDEKPPNSRPYPVIIHRRNTIELSSLSCYHPCTQTKKHQTIVPVLLSSMYSDEKPPNYRRCPVIIHVLIDEKSPSLSLSCYHPRVPSPGSSEHCREVIF